METLYHYTDLNAFLSIVQQKKLWLTGAFNLNDHQEITWALEKIARRLHEVEKKYGANDAQSLWDTIRMNSGVPYICSLSSDKDRLSQWRAYGQNGEGVAIGFKKTALPSSNRRPYLTASLRDSVSLQQVIYDEAQQDEMISNILSPLLESTEPKEQFLQISVNAAIELSTLAGIFKNSAFYEESEWRIIHRPLIMGRDDDNASNIKLSISPPRYRVAGRKIVTYFEYNFDGKPHADIFQEIVLGPKCEVSEYDLSILLTEHGLAHIPINKSKASYR